MARCYYLDYISKGFLSSYDNDEEYKKCPVYRDRR